MSEIKSDRAENAFDENVNWDTKVANDQKNGISLGKKTQYLGPSEPESLGGQTLTEKIKAANKTMRELKETTHPSSFMRRNLDVTVFAS